ncbi:MAG TPA: undecaprenyl-phosphate glucose phosphotransferase [Stellaceae bacterium]|nr:undecaprenyl-phosphate glucose phosphotransferase [Stellaceae bacterium]
MVQSYASPPSFLLSRKVAAQSRYLVRLDVMVVAAGILRAIDVALIPVTALIAYGLRFRTIEIDLGHVIVVPIGMLIIANAMSIVQAYDLRELTNLKTQLSRVTAGWAMTFALLIAIAFFDKISTQFSRLWIGSWFSLGISSSLAARCMLCAYLDKRKRQGTLTVDVAVVGTPTFTAQVRRRLAGETEFDFHIVGQFEPRIGESASDGSAATIDALLRLARRRPIHEIIVQLPEKRDASFNTMIEKLGELPANVSLCPDLSDLTIAPRRFAVLREAVMINVFERPLAGWGTILKRIEDTVLSALLLFLFLPLMGFIALLVKLDSPGPVFFRQQRFGFNNNRIWVYKFRTMYQNAGKDTSVPQARRRDPRVTTIGRILRRTSLDELPQLINVLKGEMSLVGPRPHAVAHNEYYAKLINRYLHRHRVKPGITGWAQVNGLRGETPTLGSMHERVEHDLFYIENWSIWFDLWILLRTFAVGFIHPNAY